MTDDITEDLRAAADDLVRAIDACGRILPDPATEALNRLRAVIAATPTSTVTVAMGEVGPDGWVVKPAGRL